MKVLLIEDNSALVKSLKDFLGTDDWAIDTASTGEDGIHLATSGLYDAIVLDLGLPDMNGQDVCVAIRKSEVTTPILVLSGSMQPPTKVRLLTVGADDYVTKPFHPTELRARLLALQRRGHFDPRPSTLLKADTLTLDPVSRQVERAGKKVELRRKEFDILEYLLRNRGKIMTRPMIMDNVWDGDTDSWNNTIDVHIKYLRDKIDRQFGRKLIRTAYGLGYTINEDI